MNDYTDYSQPAVIEGRVPGYFIEATGAKGTITHFVGTGLAMAFKDADIFIAYGFKSVHIWPAEEYPGIPRRADVRGDAIRSWYADEPA